MNLGGVSHLAFGVRDMDRSLAFYCGELGMEVVSDRVQPVVPSAMYAHRGRAAGAPRPDAGTAGERPEAAELSRRVAQLRWAADPDAAFLVLSSFPDAGGESIRLDEIGIHHVAWWVTDLQTKAQRLAAAGVSFVMEPTAVDARGYGGRKGEQVLTCLLQDPDGIILQFDERLG